MNELNKFDIKKLDQEQIGLIFQKLETIEEFYPCYNKMIKEK